MSLDPTGSQMRALVGAELSGRAVYMLNLLRFAGSEGEAQYRAYESAAAPFLERAGARVVFEGAPVVQVVGPSQRYEWEKVLLVRYPSKEAFLGMLREEGYPHALRRGALADSRLVCLGKSARL